MARRGNPRYFRTFVRAINERRNVSSKNVRRIIDRENKAQQILELDGAFAKKYNEFISAYNKAAADSGLSKEELLTSKKQFSVGEGTDKKTFQLKTGAKASSQSLNFKQNAQVLKKLIPDLAQSHEIGHKNISVLKANIAYTLKATKDSDVYSKEERQKLSALYTVVEEIDKIEKITGTQKEAKADLIQKLGDIAESGYDTTASYSKVVGAVAGVKGTISLELEQKDLNQFKGRLSAWVGQMFAGVVRRDYKEFEDAIKGMDISNMKGSPTIVEDIEQTVLETLDPKRKHTQKKSSTSIKEKAKKTPTTKRGRKKLKKPARRKGPKTPAQNPLALVAEFNRRLPSVIAKNMGSPALNYRTGRFSNSARVTDVATTAQGFLSFGYTYQLSPYQTFEPGYAQGSPDRDPRKIINQSMREIAMEMAIGRFYTRRV